MRISATQLAKMRIAVATLLPDTCVIYAPAGTLNPAGGYDQTLAALGTVNCRLDPLRQQNNNVVARDEKLLASYMITLPYDAALMFNYQLVVNGDYYQIATLHDDHSWRVARRAEIVRTDS
jgi:hypothetical protein